MANRVFSALGRWFGRFWRFLDGTRRAVLNLLLLVIVIGLVVAVVKRGPPELQENTALVLDLKGRIVEQRAGGLRDAALAQATGDDRQDTQLRDVLAVIDTAAKDAKIARIVLIVDDLQGAGLPVLREVGAALERFKASGKQVVAWGANYMQHQYYVAAHANELLLDPMGMVFLEGYGRFRNYYRDALDKLGVSVMILRAGKFKSAGEPFFLNGPSEAAREADSALYNGLWATYTEGAERARKVPAQTIMGYINELPDRFAAAGNDTAKLALSSRLVDGLKTRGELRAMLIERGAKDKEGKTFRQESFGDYLRRIKPKTDGKAVGVIVAEGEIVDGRAQPGTVGGLSTADLVRKARDDDNIAAVVLRVNSPGGSAFGSELVRRELEATRAAGKPVVVSMGGLAASGGYWISMASDEVIADPATITGSIGVFGLLPNGEKALDKVGVHAAGTTTTWLGGAIDPRLPFNPKFGDLIQRHIDHHYIDFTTKVAQARKTTREKIDDIAQGRVWTGVQAKERGLVDTIGSYGDALKSAAKRAKLDEEAFRVTYVEIEPGPLQRAREMLGDVVAGVLADRFDLQLVPTGVPASAVQGMRDDIARLTRFVDEGKPYAAVVHCLCREP